MVALKSWPVREEMRDHKDSSGRSRGGAWEGPGSPLILGKKKKNRRIKKSWQGK